MPIVSDYTDGCNVYVKATWADAWVLRDDLICQQLVRTLGHAVDTANFLFRSGTIMDVETDFFTAIPQEDLLGYYVRIERTIDPILDWVGYITGETQSPMGARDDGGGLDLAGADQIFQAVGLEWFLDRRQIITSVHYGSPDEYRTQRPLGFNMGFGNDRDPSQTVKGNKDTRIASSGFPSFAADAAHSEPWNASQAITYLLGLQGPSNAGYVASLPEFVFDTFIFGTFLEWFSPIVPVDGRTVLAVIRDIISPKRGVVWWLTYNALLDTMQMRVNSVAAANVSLPGGETLPLASDQVTLDTDVDRSVQAVQISRDNTSRYDSIRVRGARRVSVFTVSPADGNLIEGWNTSVYEGDYRTAGSLTTAEAADRYRRAERFQHVYCRFLIDSNWDGKSRDGSGAGTFEFSCPDMPQGSTSIVGTETFTISGLRLLRSLPLRQGYDYADATSPSAPDGANNPAELMQPFAIVKHGDKWLPLDRAAGQLDEDDSATTRLKNSYHLRVLDTVPGIEITPSSALNHAFGLNHFDTGTPAPSKTKPELDYADMRVTVAAEWDSYCEGYYPTSPPAASPLQELVIYIGERARLDYLAAGTVYDVENTTIKTVTTGGPLRDDRELCRQIAQVAYEWYQQARVTFNIQYHVVAVPVELGNFITQFGKNVPGSGSTLRTAHSTVTQISYDFEKGKSAISGGFAELDFAGLI